MGTILSCDKIGSISMINMFYHVYIHLQVLREAREPYMRKQCSTNSTPLSIDWRLSPRKFGKQESTRPNAMNVTKSWKLRSKNAKISRRPRTSEKRRSRRCFAVIRSFKLSISKKLLFLFLMSGAYRLGGHCKSL